MANETLYSGISSLIPAAYEAAMFYAMQNFYMPNLVRVYNDLQSSVTRNGKAYSAGTVATGLSESTDLDNERQTFNPSSQYTLTPAEVGTQYVIGDQRIASNDSDIMADLAVHAAYSVFGQVETDLLTHMASFTAGTVGSAGGTLTWGSVYDGVSILRASGIPAPYYVVLHEYQYRRLAQTANVAGLSNPGPLMLRDGIQSNYLVQNLGGGVFLYTTGQLTAGTAVSGGVFSQQAIGYDIRRGMRMEPQRNASLRATEVNITHVYATGLRRADWGVTLLGDASAPS